MAVKINLNQQTIYTMVNNLLKNRQTDNFALSIQYIATIQHYLQKYLTIDTFKLLNSSGKWFIVAKYNANDNYITDNREVAYNVGKEFNNAITMFGSDQIRVSEADIVATIDVNDKKYVFISIQKLTGVKESEEKTEVNEDVTPSFTVDPKTQQILSKLAVQCKQQQKKTKAAQFEIFEYDGQELANFWLNLGRVAEALSKGIVNEYVAKDLDRAGSWVFNPNMHKSPKPTDPRDIR